MIKKTFIIFFLMCSVCFAQPVALEKPNIASDKILTKAEQVEVKEYLVSNKKPIFKELTPAKNDYINRFRRGTVEFNPRKGINIMGREVFAASNYGFHKVIIPDGTTIKEVNFAQVKPHTVAITGKNLTFIDCNMNNVEIDPTWTMINCLTIHTRKVKVSEVDVEGGKEIVMIHQVEKDDKWVDVQTETEFYYDEKYDYWTQKLEEQNR